MKRIGIIGYGVVGKAFVNVFKDKVKIFIYDKYISEYNDIERVVKNCPIVFVAVPTPMYEDGSIDISCVEDALKSILAVNLPKKKLPVVVSVQPLFLEQLRHCRRNSLHSIWSSIQNSFLNEIVWRIWKEPIGS